MLPCMVAPPVTILSALLLSTLLHGLMPQAALAAAPIERESAAIEDSLIDNPALIEALHQQALELARNDQRKEALELLAPVVRDPEHAPGVTADYLVILTWDGQNARAIKLYEQLPASFDKPDYLIRDMAHAYMDEEMFEDAANNFRTLLARNPNDELTQSGLVESIFRSGKHAEAEKQLAEFIRANPSSLELNLLHPWMLEQQGKHWDAVLEYEAISRKWPDQTISTRRALIAMSHMGASSYALDQAITRLPEDLELQTEIKGDMVVDSLNWNEAKLAIAQLSPLLKEEDNLRSKFDHVVALTENEDYALAIKAYESLLEQHITPPTWVLESAAKSYLSLNQPERAIELYERILLDDPTSSESRLGKAYAHLDLGQIRDSRQILDRLDQENDWVIGEGKRANYFKSEIALAQGWLKIDEGALSQAEEHFTELVRKAPANIDFRAGLASTYILRGWPRRSLREFRIASTMQPSNLSAQTGRIDAMNDLAQKEQARLEADALHLKFPRNTGVRKLRRKLEVEQMFAIGMEFEMESGSDDSRDLLARMDLTQPLTLSTDLTAFIMHRRTSQLGEFAEFNRVGIGASHTFNHMWEASQEFSTSITGGEFGSRTELHVSPDDYWYFDFAYDSFLVDVPLHARAFGIDAARFEASASYRESDWREYGIGLNHSRFSDGNKRNEVFARFEQGLWAHESWYMRLFADAYTSTNSLSNTAYFNPSSDWSLSLTHLTRHTFFRRYDRRFSQSLYVTIGSYQQSGFSGKALGAIRYGHIYEFSDTQSLEWAIAIASHPYDGASVSSRSYYLAYLGRF